MTRRGAHAAGRGARHAGVHGARAGGRRRRRRPPRRPLRARRRRLRDARRRAPVRRAHARRRSSRRISPNAGAARRDAPDVPPALAALVMRLLAKDPAARPQSADGRAARAGRPATGAAGGGRGHAAAGRACSRAGGRCVVALGIGGYAAWRGTPAPTQLAAAAGARRRSARWPCCRS